MVSGKLLSVLFLLSLSSFILSQNCGILPSRVSTVDFVTNTPLDVADIWPFTGNPTFLRPRSNGGSLLAWGNGQGKAFIAKLDPNFQRVGSDFVLPYEHCRDVVETPDGGVGYIGVRDNPAIHDNPAKFCKDPVQNPGGAWCARVDVVRLGADGSQRWSTQVTNDRRVDTPGSHFIWWYGNFMRLGYGDGTFAIYYEGTGANERIELHQGEAGKYINDNGQLLTSGFGTCAHSSDLRLAYNTFSKKFGAFCFSDNRDVGFHFTITNPAGRKDVTVWKNPAINAAFGTMGAVVPEPNGAGFWLIHSFPEQDREGSPCNVQLSHVTGDGQIDKTVVLAGVPGLNENRPYLALYGPNKDSLLAGWSVGNTFVLALLDLNGNLVSGPTQLNNPILPTGRDWITLTNGDVAWVWKKDDRTLQITRVAGCAPTTPVPTTPVPTTPPPTTPPPTTPVPSTRAPTTIPVPTNPPVCLNQPANQLSVSAVLAVDKLRFTFSFNASPSALGCAVYVYDGTKWLNARTVLCNNQCTLRDNTLYAKGTYWYIVTCYLPCSRQWTSWSNPLRFGG